MAMVPYDIRTIGDPVLRQRARDVTEIDGALVQLVEDMFDVMYAAPGVGLAAPQIGVSRRIFVFDSDEHSGVLLNPEIVESSGEWEFVEGCLSVPGLHWPIVRPKQVLLRGIDLDGHEVEVEADEFEARIFQHEIDHLDGVLLIERLTDEQRKEAKRALRELALATPAPGDAPSVGGGGLQLP
jgi:peptide deformylase